MSEFKKGDIVRITVKERQPGWNRAGKMDKYIGMLVEVVDVMLGGVMFFVYDDADGYRWAFKSKEAELVYRPSDHSDRYEDGLNDAWEAAKHIVLNPKDGGCSYVTLKEMFGTMHCSEVLMKYSPKEAIKTISDYKQKYMEEDDLHVGDEVEDNVGRKAYVLIPRNKENGDPMLLVNGYAFPQCAYRKEWHKTGHSKTLELLVKDAYAALVGENKEDEQ